MSRKDLFENLLGWAVIGFVGFILYQIFGVIVLVVLLVPLLIYVIDRRRGS